MSSFINVQQNYHDFSTFFKDFCLQLEVIFSLNLRLNQPLSSIKEATGKIFLFSQLLRSRLTQISGSMVT